MDEISNLLEEFEDELKMRDTDFYGGTYKIIKALYFLRLHLIVYTYFLKEMNLRCWTSSCGRGLKELSRYL